MDHLERIALASAAIDALCAEAVASDLTISQRVAAAVSAEMRLHLVYANPGEVAND